MNEVRIPQVLAQVHEANKGDEVFSQNGRVADDPSYGVVQPCSSESYDSNLLSG
jgi:hypothetical protein